MNSLKKLFLPYPNADNSSPSQNLSNQVAFSIFLIILIIFGVGGYYMRFGFNPILQSLSAILAGAIFFAGILQILKLLNKLLLLIPRQIKIYILGFLVLSIFLNIVIFPWPPLIFFLFLSCFIFLLGVFFYSIYSINGKASIMRVLGIVFPIIIVAGGLLWILREGANDAVINLFADSKKSQLISQQGIESPLKVGPYEVITFTYGSGNDAKRKEYSEDVRMQSVSVDATNMLPDWKGKKKKWREKYWDFGPEKFPLNGRVSFPEGEGPFPIILIVHGNHSMTDYSDDGYGYLLDLLASKGFISVSVDENFLNGHWSGDFRGKEMPTRAWLLLKHLEQWRIWTNDPTSEVFEKVDLNNVILMGHSRGGEAVSIAAAFNKLEAFPDNALEKFDFDFGIKGVVSIAPTDYRYNRKIFIENVNYLSIQGSYDADESSFWGYRLYKRLTFSDSLDHFKSAVYIHGANHGQFNSTWDRSDFGKPMNWLMNLKPIISRQDQEKAAQVFISSFAEISLNKNKDLVPIFKNPNIAGDWLPENIYVSSFQEDSFTAIADFEEDIDPFTNSHKWNVSSENFKIWREEILTTRDKGSQENNAVLLGWDYGEMIKNDSLAIYKLGIDSSLFEESNKFNEFTFSLAKGSLSRLAERKDTIPDTLFVDAQIIFKDSEGNSVKTLISDSKNISPRIFVEFGKIKTLSKRLGKNWEPQLESFHIPLSDFVGDNEFDVSKISEIQFVFDQTPYGVIYLDDIGFQ